MKSNNEARALRPIPALIFASRWLQLPLYLGLIVAQAIYVWLFWQDMPVTVAVDANGTSVHTTGPAEWSKKIVELKIPVTAA